MLRVTSSDAGVVVTNLQTFVVSVPMSIVECEEMRARRNWPQTQKGTTRELGAKLVSTILMTRRHARRKPTTSPHPSDEKPGSLDDNERP